MQEFTYLGSDGCSLHAVTIDQGHRHTELSIILQHGGGPDHHSLLPLGKRLRTTERILLPDLRGYGRRAEEITVPTLIVPGNDFRHPLELAELIADLVPKGRLSRLHLSPGIRTVADFAEQLSPVINSFLTSYKTI